MGLWKSPNLNSKSTITNHKNPSSINPGSISTKTIIKTHNSIKEHKLSTTFTHYLNSINHKLISSNLICNLKDSFNNKLSKNSHSKC